MNHPAIPSRRPSLNSRLRAAWRTFRSPRPVLTLPPWEVEDLTVPIYVCAALHLQRGGGRSTLSLGTLQTTAPAHHIEAAFLGHLVNHSPELKAQQLLHVCTVPYGQVTPYPSQP